MTSRRRFQSLIHNLYEKIDYPHGQSYFYDDLHAICKEHGHNCVVIDLVNPPPGTQVFSLNKRLLTDLPWMQRKYQYLLFAEGFTPAYVQSARITVHFSVPFDESVGEFFDVLDTRDINPRYKLPRRTYLHVLHVSIVDDLGRQWQKWYWPWRCKRILGKPENVEELVVTPNEEALNAPVLYAGEDPNGKPESRAHSSCGCSPFIQIIAAMQQLSASLFK